jgi:hypothetical protein
MQYLQDLRLCIDAGNDAVNQIGTVERADEHRRVLKTQLLGDVGANAFGGRCRVRVHASPRKASLEFGKLAVFGPKVMTPMADAVGFINGECAHLQPLDELQKAGRQQALRSYKDQPVTPGGNLSFGLANGIDRHAAV